MPSSPSAPDWLTRRPFAHRGLHGDGAIENSRAAFRVAIAGGFGIECDVQPSWDGVAHVFHDDRLERLTDKAGPIAARTAAELATSRLLPFSVIPAKAGIQCDQGVPFPALDPGIRRDDEERECIPTLAEMLALVDGSAPLLVEVKAKGPLLPLCRAVARDLAAYQGEAAVMSFSPRVARWFARAQPDRLRGLVVTERERRGSGWAIVRRLALRWSRAQFVAVDCRDLPSAFAAYARARGLPVLTWTVRSAADRATAAVHADQIIFERPA